MQHEITTFTVTLMQAGGASNEQSDRAYSYVRAADELESIADYATSFSSYMKRLDKHELHLMRKVQRLLYISHKPFIEGKLKARDEAAGGG